MKDYWETWKLSLMKKLNDRDREGQTHKQRWSVNGNDCADLIESVVKTCPVPFANVGFVTNTNKLPSQAENESIGKPHDPVNHPSRYTQGAAECIDAIAAALGPEDFVAFLRGQVIKYLWRLGRKDVPTQEAGKAAWYLKRLEEALAKKDPVKN